MLGHAGRRWVALMVFLLVVAIPAAGARGSLRINEFMAANSHFLADPQGEYDDWIEVHNTGRTPVNMAGMFLTDDPAVPTQWQIPTDRPAYSTVPPDGYLLIWLDGDTADGGLHAPFRLDAMGDEIALFDADGETLLDEVHFEQQRGDIAYGRVPNAGETWGYLRVPSPGGANAPAYEGVVSDPTFSHTRGFYDGPFEVTITCDTPDATIYYTLDGTDPLAQSARMPFGRLYTGPIRISETTCLRVAAVRNDWLTSNVVTHTYLFPDDVITRRHNEVLSKGYPASWYGSFPADYGMDPEIYTDPAYAHLIDDAMQAIPTVSLVTDKDHLFKRQKDPETGGIYIYTGHGSTGGQDWERPASVELFTADGNREFQVNCGIRIQGGEGRKPEKCPKHSLSLRFRSEYGPSRLEFPLFGDGPVQQFDSLQLRGFFNNAWTHWAPDQRERTQYIRDQWMRDALLDMGQPDAGRGIYVHLYLNGIYWGLYNLHERPVADHYAAYHGGDPETVDAINGGRATDGTTQAWSELRGIAARRDWGQIVQAIDLDNFIDWSLANLFAGNTDLKNNGNWRAAGGGLGQRPWRFYSWDAEHVMESLYHSGTRPSSDPTGLFNRLDDIEEFRIRFADRVHKHLFNGGALTAERNIERWRRRADEIELAVIAESARWGDYRRDVHSFSSGPYRLYTRDDFWVPQREWLMNDYLPRRTDIALDQFRSRGLYPPISAPVFQVNGVAQHGGPIGRSQLLSMPGDGTVWYTLDGTDPRIPGIEAGPVDKTTLVSEGAAKRVLVPNGPVSDAWRGGAAFDDSTWTAGKDGVGYERSAGYESFIGIDVQSRMYNRATTCLIRIPFRLTAADLADVGGLLLKVRYDDGFVAYLNGTEVARRNFQGQPAWNSSASSQNSDSDAVNLETISISGHIDTLQVGGNVLAVQALNISTTSSDLLFSAQLASIEGFADGAEAGVAATANRYTDPITLDRSAVVKARALAGTTWSALSEAVFAVGPVAESLRISEIMYHPADTDDPNSEFIELTNVGAETIDLNLVRFTDGIDYTFDPYELPPGGYCLLVRDRLAFEARYGADLPVAGQYDGSLRNGGERIELVDAAEEVIQSFEFDDGWYTLTDGLGFSLTVREPGQAGTHTLNDKAAWKPSDQPGGSPGIGS